MRFCRSISARSVFARTILERSILARSIFTPVSALILSVALFVPVQSAWVSVPVPQDAGAPVVIVDTPQFLFCAFENASGEPLGLYRTGSESPGDVWEAGGLEGVRIWDAAYVPAGDGVLLAAGQDAAKVYRSTDWGDTWTPVGENLPGATGTTLSWNGGDPGRVYAVTRDTQGQNTEWISVSTDLGLTWSTIHSEAAGQYIRRLSTRLEGGLEAWMDLYDGYWMSSVHRSGDGGENWELLSSPSWEGPPLGLCTPRGTDRVYSLIWPRQVLRWLGSAAESTWILRSDDLATGLAAPEWWPGTVVIAGVDGEGKLFAAHRSNEDPDWQLFSQGLPQEASPSPEWAWWRFPLVAGTERPVLYLGSATLGLWMRDMSGLADADETASPRAGLSFEVSPNPSSGVVRFAVNGPMAAPYEVRILDVAGRQVVAFQSQGNEVIWDWSSERGSAVPAGAYFAHVRCGDFDEVRRIVRLP